MFFSQENKYSAHFTKGNSFRVTLYNGAEHKLLNIEHLREVLMKGTKRKVFSSCKEEDFILKHDLRVPPGCHHRLSGSAN